MRLPLTGVSVPGPSDLMGLAADVRNGVRDALDLVPRAAELLSRAGTLLGRAEAAVDVVELLMARVESAVDAITETSLDAAVALTKASAVTEDVGRLVTHTKQTSRSADQVVDGAAALLARSEQIMVAVTPLFEQLMPVARRLAESLEPKEVDAAIGLVDRLPVVLQHLDEDVLPILRQLDRVGPDVHQLLEITDDLRNVIAGLPGAGLLKKMGDRKELDGG